MIAAFTAIDEANIRARLWIAEDCHPLPGQGVPHGPWRKKNDREREAKRAKVTAASDKFFAAMNSNNPPQSKEETIRVVVGALGMLLSYLFPQLALTIRVLGWLWDFTHG